MALRLGLRTVLNGGYLVSRLQGATVPSVLTSVAPQSQHSKLHTSPCLAGVLQIPPRLVHIPEAEESVGYILDLNYYIVICRILASLKWLNISSTRPVLSWRIF